MSQLLVNCVARQMVEITLCNMFVGSKGVMSCLGLISVGLLASHTHETGGPYFFYVGRAIGVIFEGGLAAFGFHRVPFLGNQGSI